jgi:hypothetical protein
MRKQKVHTLEVTQNATQTNKHGDGFPGNMKHATSICYAKNQYADTV